MIEFEILGKKVDRDAKPDLLDLQEKYKSVFSSDYGREVLLDMMERNFFFRTTYVPKDSHASAVQEGQRGVILAIVNFINRNPNEIKKMLDHGKEEEDVF